MVRVDSKTLDFIYQISLEQNLPLPSSITAQPLHREDITSFIELALSGDELTKIERETAMLIYSWYGGDKNIIALKNDHSRFQINLNLTGDIKRKNSDSLALNAKGIINPGVTGFLGGLSFNSEYFVWTEFQSDTMWGKSNYEPYNGNPYNLFGREDSGNVRASDLFRGSVTWQFKMLTFDFGIDKYAVGPSIKNRLLLDINENPATYIRATANFKWFNYYHTYGLLRSMKYYSKYFVHHRFDIPIFNKKFNIGLNEVIVFGSTADSAETAKAQGDPLSKSDYNITRNFEPAYAVPFVPFAFIEHFGGDRDNALLSLDLSLRLPKYFYWYFEFLLDDMSNPATLFSNDYGNKWGLTVGGKWNRTFENNSFGIVAEYSRIEPWVYTHFKGVSQRYTNFGKSIGSPLGPNSDQIWSEVSWQPSLNSSFSFAFTRQRWNHNYRGGDISHVFITEKNSSDNGIPEDSTTKDFLSGDISKRNHFSLGWNFLPYRIFEVESSVSYDNIDKLGFSLYGGFRF